MFSRNRVVGSKALFFLAWVPHALLVFHFWFVIDDAFISFRYARNWAEGHGLRYNLGEHPPEEGYSNFLWVALCAVIELLDGDPVTWAPFMSFLSSSALLFLVFRTLQNDFQLSPAIVFLTTLALGVFPPFALWSTGGLATMPFALAFFLTFHVLVIRPEGIPPLRAGLFGSVLSLLRFEGVAWALFIGAVALVSRTMRKQPAWRPLLVYFAIVTATFSAYFAWRYAYYQHLFPNSVYLKARFGPDVAVRGFRSVVTFLLTFLTPLLLLPTPVVALQKSLRPVGVALVAVALSVPAYTILLGGDWMPMWRFLIPAMAINALLLGLLLQLLWTHYPMRRALVVAALLLTTGVGLLPAFNLHIVPESLRRPFHFRYGWPNITEHRLWFRSVEIFEESRDKAIAWNQYGRAGDSLIADSIGIIGYYTDFFIYDQFGLVTREVTVLPSERPLHAPPGLDVKVLPDFFFDRNPTFLTPELITGERVGGRLSLRQQVIDKAEAWREQRDLLTQRYAPDFFHLPLDPELGTARVVLLLRAIEEDPGSTTHLLPRPERDRVRARRAQILWEEFFERAQALPLY